MHKGSITVDGISLTVAALDADGFTVAVIPHTLAVTTLGGRQPGAAVNLEVDVIAKYVERLDCSRRDEEHNMTFDQGRRSHRCRATR